MQVQGFKYCVTGWENRREQYQNFFTGLVKGIKGSNDTNTDCLDSTLKMLEDLKTLWKQVQWDSLKVNIMAPVDSVGYLLIAQGNLNTACVASVQSAQMNQKFNTLSGLGDLLYTVLNYPIEGFFNAQTDPTIKNQIWDAVLNLYVGWNTEKYYNEDFGG